MTTATTTDSTTTAKIAAFPPQDAGTPMGTPAIDNLAINTIRTLSMDAVQTANSGHPGTPMALAPVAYTLWQDFLRYDPADPNWPNRDRFVLSNGHASMLLYSLLHLAGVERLDARRAPTGEPAVPLDDIKRFRQLGSVCPGHPEHAHDRRRDDDRAARPGLATSVGMAIASQWLARPLQPARATTLFDYRVYALCGDGDLMEGMAAEAASLAGHLGLVEPLLDLRQQPHHDRRARPTWRSPRTWPRASRATAGTCCASATPTTSALRARAARPSRRDADRPTLIIVESHIGYGSPKKQDTRERARRAARRGGDQGDQARLRLAGRREVPRARRACASTSRESSARRGAALRAPSGTSASPATRRRIPSWRDEMRLMLRAPAARGLGQGISPAFPADAKGIATRDASGAGAQRDRARACRG